LVRPFTDKSNFAAVFAGAALLAGLLVAVFLLSASARAADAGQLEAKLTAARGEASSISAGLRESNDRLYAAEGEAAAAQAHEARLSGLLAEGQAREAELSRKLARTREQLAAARARLRRSHHALAARLVAIYESGTPDATSIFLESGSYDEVAVQADYLREITEADSALAERVEAVRNEAHQEAEQVAVLKRRAIAYDERLAAAREEISAVREAAQAAAAELAAVSAARQASLARLRGQIGGWVTEIQEARAAEARAASVAEAEEEVGRWLGGPYAIPTYIVMCESGGDYGAVNPSSGAGGAYQILPSTWELYGGQGEPQNASKAEQDRIAGEIWADSGSSAWVCG
jgi:septal ring factor EnvC (AmiA/AmiB activator)